MKRTFRTVALLSAVMVMFAIDASAQKTAAKGGNDDKEKKEEPKEKVVERVVEKSGPSIQQELKKFFGVKTETSLTGPRIENIGKYFLDKHTGEVMMMSYYKNEPIRWRILRDHVEDDYIVEDQEVNYQLVKYDTAESDLLLINVNSGVMWSLEFKGLGFNNKNSRFQYVPMKDTEW